MTPDIENPATESNGNATIDAVTGLVKAIPVYQDVAQPAAQEIDKSLLTVAKLVNIVLAPVSVCVWGYDRIADFVTKRVSEKLKNVPEENIIIPKALIAGPAIEALKYAGEEEHLRELYANLIATAMDKSTAQKAQPGFVEILKSMSSDEALIMKLFENKLAYPLVHVHSRFINSDGQFLKYRNHTHLGKLAGCQIVRHTPTYIDNLIRLGLPEIPADTHYSQVKH
jgi:hypothetical protein